MKTFIFSFIATVAAITLAAFPTVSASPLEIFPRICFYFGFPGAFLLSVVFIIIQHLLGSSKAGIKSAGKPFESGKINGKSVEVKAA